MLNGVREDNEDLLWGWGTLSVICTLRGVSPHLDMTISSVTRGGFPVKFKQSRAKSEQELHQTVKCPYRLTIPLPHSTTNP